MIVPPYQNWLLIVAMDVEERAVLARLPNHRPVEISSRLDIKANVATSSDRRLFVAKSGVGPVNAALTTAFIAEQFPVDAILLLGVAGALHGDLRVGDLVLADRVIQHDAVCSGPDGMELMAPGHLHVSLPKDKRPEPSLGPDEDVREWLLSLLADSKNHERVLIGTLLSGNEFVASPARKRTLAAAHDHVLAVEMEAAGVGQVARKLGIPFVVAKTIADRLMPEGAVADEYLQFMERAAENAALIVDLILDKWTHD